MIETYEEVREEEREMLYTLSVNLEYFSKEMDRASQYYQVGKKAEDYTDIAKMLRMTCKLIKDKLEELNDLLI